MHVSYHIHRISFKIFYLNYFYSQFGVYFNWRIVFLFRIYIMIRIKLPFIWDIFFTNIYIYWPHCGLNWIFFTSFNNAIYDIKSFWLKCNCLKIHSNLYFSFIVYNHIYFILFIIMLTNYLYNKSIFLETSLFTLLFYPIIYCISIR